MNKSIYKPTFTRKLSSIFKFLATGCFTLLLSACYGTVQVMYGAPMDLSALITNGQTEEPLPNIKVTFKSDGLNHGSARTNKSGIAAVDQIYSYSQNGTILCEDTDGTDNGGEFQDVEVAVDFSSTYHSIELQPK